MSYLISKFLLFYTCYFSIYFIYILIKYLLRFYLGGVCGFGG